MTRWGRGGWRCGKPGLPGPRRGGESSWSRRAQQNTSWPVPARRYRGGGSGRLAVRSANCSCRRAAKTSAGPTTPFARQAAANRAPHLRMRSLWTGFLLAPRGLWPRQLSLGTYPPVATCKANTGKTPRFLRFPVPAHRVPVAGRGAYAIHALPDLRDGIVSERLVRSTDILLRLSSSPGTPGAFFYSLCIGGQCSRGGVNDMGRP